MQRLFRVNYSISSIEWSLFDVLTRFLARDPEIWTIVLVASTFKSFVDFGPHQKFNGALHRGNAHYLQLRLSWTKLIWASNSLPILRSKLSPHDWEWWNQKISMMLIFCLQMLYNWFILIRWPKICSFLSFWDFLSESIWDYIKRKTWI